MPMVGVAIITAGCLCCRGWRENLCSFALPWLGQETVQVGWNGSAMARHRLGPNGGSPSGRISHSAGANQANKSGRWSPALCAMVQLKRRRLAGVRQPLLKSYESSHFVHFAYLHFRFASGGSARNRSARPGPVHSRHLPPTENEIQGVRRRVDRKKKRAPVKGRPLGLRLRASW